MTVRVVYVEVTHIDGSVGFKVIGVFSSVDKAKEAIAQYFADKLHPAMQVCVDEMEIDTRSPWQAQVSSNYMFDVEANFG